MVALLFEPAHLRLSNDEGLGCGQVVSAAGYLTVVAEWSIAAAVMLSLISKKRATWRV